ncbi:hypothetical protein KSP40_PGU006377 [Platanthera guangdongensis]|uniref:Uncharacterized protein n=1 Tax=Platanthera guangdongensis TaxID=2320717 RepID=A0ABR2MN77_9ASPA
MRRWGRPWISGDSDTHEDFRPASKLEGSGFSVHDVVQQDVKINPVMIYMKGVPDAPRCGFSALAHSFLQSFLHLLIATSIEARASPQLLPQQYHTVFDVGDNNSTSFLRIVIYYSDSDIFDNISFSNIIYSTIVNFSILLKPLYHTQGFRSMIRKRSRVSEREAVADATACGKPFFGAPGAAAFLEIQCGLAAIYIVAATGGVR